MSSANLTMLGMFKYDKTLFDDLTFPAGINKDTAVDEILIECGEFEVIYPDVDFMKSIISHWGRKHYRTFEKWVEGLSKEFDPLYNFDRHEVYIDTHKSSDNETSQNSSSSNTNTSSENSSSSSTNTNSNTTDSRDVSAYDSNSMQPREKELSNGNVNETGSASGNSTGSETTTGSNNGTVSRNGEVEVVHDGHLYGNIGVTTSTQMLEDFLRVEKWNLYENIAELFVDEFCIRIY